MCGQPLSEECHDPKETPLSEDDPINMLTFYFDVENGLVTDNSVYHAELLKVWSPI